MTRLRDLATRLALVATLFLALACWRPKPPTIVPKEAEVVGVEVDALSLVLSVEMTNPNGFAMHVQRVTGTVKVQNTDIGRLDVPHTLTLPSKVPTLVEVPIRVRWEGALAMASVAAQGKDVPFTVDGKVGVGSERLSVELPFSLSGVITQQQLQQALIRSIQKQIFPIVPSTR